MMAGEGSLELHKAAWEGNADALKELLSKETHKKHINQLDHHGNTPLHIAAHFSWLECMEILIKSGANTEILSSAGWKAFDEATASGDMEGARLLMTASHTQYRKHMLAEMEAMHTKLLSLPDFYMEIHWDFQLLGGWVPLVQSYIPNDVYKMWKKGNSIRMDYSLVGFKNFSITRGHVSLLLAGSSSKKPGHLFVINHDQKTIQDFVEEPGPSYSTQIDNSLNYLFAHDICSYLPLSKGENQSNFRPVTSWFSGAHKEERVCGGLNSHVYSKDFWLISRYRSDPDVKKTRIPRTPSEPQLREEHLGRKDIYFREMEEKIEEDDEEEEENKYFGKGLLWETEKPRETVKKYNGHVWMTKDFPLSAQQLLDLVSIYSPTSQHWKKLEEYLAMELPDGFPAKVEVPVGYGVTAKVEFRNFQENITTPEDFFSIPEDYTITHEAYVGQETREMFKSAKEES